MAVVGNPAYCHFADVPILRAHSINLLAAGQLFYNSIWADPAPASPLAAKEELIRPTSYGQPHVGLRLVKP